MLSAIGSLVTFGVGGELLSKGIQKAGRGTLSYAFKSFNFLKASGAGLRSVFNHVSKTSSFNGLRSAFHEARRDTFTRLTRDSELTQDRFRNNIISGYNRRIDHIARKVGGKKAFSRRVVKDAIKGEVKFLPMNYLMYKHEQHSGNISQDTSFASYYATTGMPMSLLGSVGIDVTKRKFKVAGYRAFRNNKAAVFGLEAIAKLGAESIHRLNNVTKGMAAVYDQSVSKFMRSNATFGAFRGTTAAIREIGHVAHTTNTRSARRSDFLRYKARARDLDIEDTKDHLHGYMQMQGDLRNQAKPGSRVRQDISTLSEGEGELVRTGINRGVNRTHSFLRRLSGDKYYGDDIGYTTARAKYKSTEFRETDTGKKGFEVTKHVTKDRGRISLLGEEYNFGNFHIDAIRDSLDKIVTQTFNIANRPWLNFLDGGNNWLMSKKTKMLQFGTKKGVGVVGLGMKGTTSITVAAQTYDGSIDNINENNYKEHALLGIRNVFGLAKDVPDGQEDLAVKYLKSVQNRALEFVKKSSQKLSDEEIKENVTKRMALKLRRGELEFGTGDVLDTTGGGAVLHTNVEGFGKHKFVLHHAGEELKGVNLLRGDTRAGQLAAGILGGHEDFEIGGLTVSTGIETTKTIGIDKYYDHLPTKAQRFTSKIGGLLEWNGGTEQSLLSRFTSIFTKWEDPRYLGSTVQKLKIGDETIDSLKYKFKTKTGDFYETMQLVKSANSYSEGIVKELFNSLKVSSEHKASLGKEYDMPAMMAKIKGAISSSDIAPQYGSFLRDFNPDNMIIGSNESVVSMRQKLGHMRSFYEKHGNTAEELGFGLNKLGELDELLSRSGTGLGHSALGSTLKNGIDARDQYNRSVFEALMGISATNKESAKAVGDVLNIVSLDAMEVGKRGAFKKSEITRDGIVNALMLRKNTNKFMESRAPEVEESVANDLAYNIADLKNHYDRFGLFDVIKPFGNKKRLKEVPSAENKYIIVAENNFSHLDTTGFTQVPISRGQVEQLAAVNTMNSALSIIGIGFDLGNKTVTIGDVVQKTLLKRVLPFAGLMAAHDFATSGIQSTPGLQNTSLAGGVTGMLWDAYAGARVLSQTVSDFTGITAVANYAENLLPGSIDSPLSGLVRGMLPIAMGLKMGTTSRVGPMRGGLIGSGVGMLLGGGPLGLFGDWDISKGRERVIQELSGEKEIEVRKGRFWEMSGGSFFGNKTSYFRPHMYALQKSQYQRGSNYMGDDGIDELTSYIDPGVYARKHYLSRPYPVVGGMGSNLPLIGNLVGAVSGEQYMHQDFLQEMSNSSLLNRRVGGLPEGTTGGTGISSGTSFYGGSITGAPSNSLGTPDTPSSFSTVVDETGDNLLDVAGLRGFVLGSAISGIADSNTGFGGGTRLESANNIASISKQYWEKELGGIVGMSEGLRRIMPNPNTGGVEYWNEIANVMPTWLPGKDSFIDFLTGDPYSKVQYGEARLPGESYEMVKNVFYTYPIDSSMMRRPYEEQVGFYAGDVTTLSTMRRRWHVVERTRKEFVGELKKSMAIVKEKDVAYDPDNDVHAYIDAISEDPTGAKTAILIAPVNDGYLDPAGEAQLNAFLVNNSKDIHDGLLIGLDKDGNATKQIVRRDIKKYLEDVKSSQAAARAGAGLTKDLQSEGNSVNRWSAYSHLNRLEILLNVAPFSNEAQLEMKVVKKQQEAGQFGPKQKEKFKELMGQFVDRLNSMDTKEYRFLPLLMGKTPLGNAAIKRMEETEKNYSAPEQAVGAAYEYITHLRNPISNKLIGNRSAYEAYRQDVAIGKGFKSWNDPINDYMLNPLEMVTSEEDPIQAAMSGATGGFIFGGPIGAGLGAAGAGLASLLGATSNERSTRWEKLDHIQVMADALKFKEIEQMDEAQVGTERRFTLRKKQSAYYNYTQGYQEGPSGANDILGSVNASEKSYVKRILQNMYKEDVEQIGALLPEHARPFLDSYANQTQLDTSGYSKYASDARRIVQGAPLKFRSDDMVYKTLQNQGYNAHDLSLGWKQQINRVKYIEQQGNDIPDLQADTGYPGLIPNFGAIRL